MKTIDYELLRKRRGKILKLRTKTEEKQNIGIGYELIIESRHYPVMACFPAGSSSTDNAESKFKYLIIGQKS